MEGTFENAGQFDQDISGWDVSSVTTMKNMFKGANQFDQDIGAWDVSSVTNMEGMFDNAHEFDRSIGAWDVSSVTTMERMFLGTWKFDQGVGAWDVSSVATMEDMFNGASKFNQNISAWDVSSVTTMKHVRVPGNSLALSRGGTPPPWLIRLTCLKARLLSHPFSSADGSSSAPTVPRPRGPIGIARSTITSRTGRANSALSATRILSVRGV